MSINLHDIPVPERRYVADTVWLDRKEDVVRFMFAQTGKGGHPRSLLIVTMFPDPARQLLKSCADFLPPLYEFLKRNDIRETDLRQIENEPSQTVALIANLVAVTYVGREAEMDFFHLAPNALRKVNQTSEVAIDPIVRIDLATASMSAVLRRLDEMKADLPPEVK